LSPTPLSSIPLALVTATGGLLAGIGVGLSVSGALLWRQQRALTRMRHDAMHDALTGLHNRRAALDHLNDVLHTGRPVGVILLDLDRFKAVNDTYGHHGGDHVLVEVGRRLAALPAPKALAARIGGDEFLLVVHGDSDAVARVARAAFTAVTEPITLGGHRLHALASVGYATAEAGTNVRQLVHHADMAMYRAKTTRTGVCSATTPFSPPGRADARRRWRDRR
jgi:diguanylate cyclase (GGDEF)-like protein